MSSSTNNHPAAYLAASGDADGQALHEAPNGRAEASIRDSPQPRGAAIATSPIYRGDAPGSLPRRAAWEGVDSFDAAEGGTRQDPIARHAVPPVHGITNASAPASEDRRAHTARAAPRSYRDVRGTDTGPTSARRPVPVRPAQSTGRMARTAATAGGRSRQDKVAPKVDPALAQLQANAKVRARTARTALLASYAAQLGMAVPQGSNGRGAGTVGAPDGFGRTVGRGIGGAPSRFANTGSASGAPRGAGALGGGVALGPDGRPADTLTGAALSGVESEAKMLRSLAQWQENSYSESSKLLQRLRREYDYLRTDNKARQQEVGKVTGELDRLERVMIADRERAGYAHDLAKRKTDVEDRRSVAEHALRQAEQRYHMLQHMTERLKNSNTDLDQRVKVLQKAGKVAKQQANVASNGVGARRAEASAARALAEHLQNYMSSQRGHRESKLARVQQAMKDQEARRAAFDDKERRRLHIPELPRGDLDEAGEERLKQLFLVRRIYGSMLARRLREDTRRCDRLEAAFQRIRAATGLADTEAIVQRFSHREETLSSLRQQLHAARERLASLRDERRRLVWRLDDAQTSTGKERERRALYAKLEDLESRRATAKRRVGESRSRLYRVSVVLEACRASVARLLRRLGVPVEERQGGIGLDNDGDELDDMLSGDIDGKEDADLDERRGQESKEDADGEGHGLSLSKSMERLVGGHGTVVDSPTDAESTRSKTAAAGTGAQAARLLAMRASSARASTNEDAQMVLGSTRRSLDDRDGPETRHVSSSGNAGTVVVSSATLDSALGQLEAAVSRALAHLTAVFEREEAIAARAGHGSTDAGAIGALDRADGSGGAPAARSLSAALLGRMGILRQGGGSKGEGTADGNGAHGAGGVMGERLIASLLALPPNLSDDNVRVNARASTPEPDPYRDEVMDDDADVSMDRGAIRAAAMDAAYAEEDRYLEEPDHLLYSERGLDHLRKALGIAEEGPPDEDDEDDIMLTRADVKHISYMMVTENKPSAEDDGFEDFVAATPSGGAHRHK